MVTELAAALVLTPFVQVDGATTVITGTMKQLPNVVHENCIGSDVYNYGRVAITFAGGIVQAWKRVSNRLWLIRVA